MERKGGAQTKVNDKYQQGVPIIHARSVEPYKKGLGQHVLSEFKMHITPSLMLNGTCLTPEYYTIFYLFRKKCFERSIEVLLPCPFMKLGQPNGPTNSPNRPTNRRT